MEQDSWFLERLQAWMWGEIRWETDWETDRWLVVPLLTGGELTGPEWNFQQ